MDQPENTSSTSANPPLPNSGTVEENSSSPKSHKFLIVGLVLLLLLTAGAAAYVFAQNQSLKSQLGLGSVCEHEGKTYQVGEGFTDSDGCNTCTCGEDGQVACTTMACVADEELPLSLFSDWLTYVSLNNDYSFKYPPDANLNPYQEGEYEGVSVSFIGPTQAASGRTQTELSEGYGMSIIEIPNIDAQSLAESSWDADNQSSDPEIPHSISKIKVIEIGSKTGYQYEVSNRGSAIVTFVPLSDKSLRIVARYAGFTPKQKDEYYKIQGQILSTFEFITSTPTHTPSKSMPVLSGADLEGIGYTLPPEWTAEIRDNSLHFSPADGGYVIIQVYDYDAAMGRRQFYCQKTGFCIDGITYFEEAKIGNISGYVANALDNSGGGEEYFGNKGNKFYILNTYAPPLDESIDQEQRDLIDSLIF